MYIIKAYVERIKGIYSILEECVHSYRMVKPRKALARQIREFVALNLHWHTFPQQYFQHRMFAKGNKLSLNQMKSYVPPATWWRISQRAHIPHNYSIICTDKSLFADLMDRYGLPHPGIILKYRGKRFYGADGQPLTDSAADALIQSQESGRLILKYSVGRLGRDIFAYDSDGEGNYKRGGEILSAKQIRQRCGKRPFILQPGVEQCVSLSRVYPDSVNSIRVLSRYRRGQAKIIAASIRFGRDGQVVDNMHKGGLSLNVDLETGRLGRVGTAFYDTLSYEAHPNSGVRFEDVTVEHWQELKDLIEKACHAFHELEFAGWDVAMSVNGPVILEINACPDLYLSQLTAGGLAAEVCS